MFHRPFFSLLPCLALTFSAPLALVQAQQPQQTTAEGVFLQAYMLKNEAEKLEDQKNYAAAWYKYKSASDLFDSVARLNPNWEPNMVNYRRSLIRKSMERTQNLERERRGVATGAPSATAGTEAPLPTPAGVEMRPAFPVQPQPGVAQPSVDSVISGVNSNLNRNQADYQKIQDVMAGKEKELFETKSKLLSAKKELEAYMQKNLELSSKLTTAEQRKDREVASLKKQLEELTAALNKAKTLQDEAISQIDALTGELGSARETINNLTKERDGLLAEKSQMSALMKSNDDSKKTTELLAENKRLKEELDKAKTSMTRLQSDKDAAVKEAAGLRDQVAKLRDDLERVQKENQDYRQQISGLTTKLEEASARLADASPNNLPPSELEAENKVLRNIIYAELKHQAVREGKKRLLLEQFAKLQIDSKEIFDAVNALAAPPAGLSAEEEKILTDPKTKELLQGKGMALTLLDRPPGAAASADEAGSPAGAEAVSAVRGKAQLDEDARIMADAGEAAFGQRRFAEMEKCFTRVVERDRQNVYALSNASVAQIFLKKYPEAQKNLQKALAYHFEDDHAHYLLGMTYYKQGDYERAQRSFQQAVQLNNANSRAHFSLGCVYTKQGVVDKAKREFLAALEVDPAYGDAQYNLAVLAFNAGEKEKALKFYNQSLENDSPRDAQLETELARRK